MRRFLFIVLLIFCSLELKAQTASFITKNRSGVFDTTRANTSLEQKGLKKVYVSSYGFAFKDSLDVIRAIEIQDVAGDLSLLNEMQAAAKALPTTGGAIFTPFGRFRMEGVDTIYKNNTKIYGYGTELYFTDSTTHQPTRGFYAYAKSGIEIEGFRIVGSKLNNQSAIWFESCSNFIIKNNRIDSIGLHGIMIGNVLNTYTDSVSHGGVIYGNIMNENRALNVSQGSGIFMIAGAYNIIIEKNVIKNSYQGIVVDDASTSTTYDPYIASHDITIANNIIDSVVNVGILVEGSTAVTVTGNKIRDCNYGIAVFNFQHGVRPDSNLISNNTISNFQTQGIGLTSGSHNDISNNKLSSGATGIIIQKRSASAVPVPYNSNDSTARNNRIFGNRISYVSSTAIVIADTFCVGNIIDWNYLSRNNSNISNSGKNTAIGINWFDSLSYGNIDSTYIRAEKSDSIIVGTSSNGIFLGKSGTNKQRQDGTDGFEEDGYNEFWESGGNNYRSGRDGEVIGLDNDNNSTTSKISIKANGTDGTEMFVMREDGKMTVGIDASQLDSILHVHGSAYVTQWLRSKGLVQDSMALPSTFPPCGTTWIIPRGVLGTFQMTCNSVHNLDSVAAAASNHNILSSTHSDATAATVVRGDIITGQAASPLWKRLALGVSGKILQSDGTDLVYSTPTYPLTTTANQLLYSTSTNVIDGLATANNSVLVTSAGGVPSWDFSLPSTVDLAGSYIYRAGGTDVAVADGGTGLSSYAVGDLVHATGTGTLAGLADVATGSVLTSGGVGVVPAWSASPTLTTSLTVPTMYGSASSGGNLTLYSTSHATKGKLLFGTSAYDEVNNRLGLGNVTPLQTLMINNGGDFAIHNITPDATNFERIGVRWISNQAFLLAEAGGTGTARELFVGAQAGAGTYNAIRFEDTGNPRVRIGFYNTSMTVQSTGLGSGADWLRMGEITSTASSGVVNVVAIRPTYNQTLTGGGTDLLLDRVETAIGSGEQLFFNARVGGTSRFKIDNKAGTTLTQPVITSGSPTLLTLIGGAHTTLTASTEASLFNINGAQTVQFATGALTTQRMAVFQAPTYGFVGASTLTNASTVAITGAPIAGTNATITNSYALNVQAGKTNLGGDVAVGGDANISGNTVIQGSTDMQSDATVASNLTVTSPSKIVQDDLVYPIITVGGSNTARTFTVNVRKFDTNSSANTRFMAHWWTSTSSYGSPSIPSGSQTVSVTTGTNFGATSTSTVNHAYTDASGNLVITITNVNTANATAVYFHIEIMGIIYVATGNVYITAV